MSLLFSAFLEYNEECNGSTSVRERIRNIVARRVTDADMFAAVLLICMYAQPEKHTGVDAVAKASNSKCYGCSELEEELPSLWKHCIFGGVPDRRMREAQ